MSDPNQEINELNQTLANLDISNITSNSVFTDTGHGKSYRLKILMLQFLIASDTYEKFELSQLGESVKDLSPIILRYSIKEQNKIMILQPRHALDNNALIEACDFFTTSQNSNFLLAKYFMEWMRFLVECPNLENLKFVICTNKKLNFVDPPTTECRYEMLYRARRIFFDRIDREEFKLINDYGGELYRIKTTEPATTEAIVNLILEKYVQLNDIPKGKKNKGKKIKEKKVEDPKTEKEKEIIFKLIENFLSRLIIAVKQPNDERLDGIIVSYLSNKFEHNLKGEQIEIASNSISTLTKFTYQGILYKWTNQQFPFPLNESDINMFYEILQVIKNVWVMKVFRIGTFFRNFGSFFRNLF